MELGDKFLKEDFVNLGAAPATGKVNAFEFVLIVQAPGKDLTPIPPADPEQARATGEKKK